LTDKQKHNPKTATQAEILLSSFCDFEFQFILRALGEVFDRTGKLSDVLQSSELEMDQCEREIESALDRLGEIRTTDAFDQLYKTAVEFSEEHELDLPELPRQSGAAKNRPVEFETAEDRYKSNYFEIIDSVIKEIKSRLQNDGIDVLKIMSKIIKGKATKNDVQELAEYNFYNKMVDFDKLEEELEAWNKAIEIELKKKKAKNEVSSIVKIFVEQNMVRDYFEIETLLRVYLAIPVTSVTAERCFSSMKRIKTYLRNSMGQTRLSSLAIIHIEKELASLISLKRVIDQFASLSNRKLQFF
jgi:hypothetical protein